LSLLSSSRCLPVCLSVLTDGLLFLCLSAVYKNNGASSKHCLLYSASRELQSFELRPTQHTSKGVHTSIVWHIHVLVTEGSIECAVCFTFPLLPPLPLPSPLHFLLLYRALNSHSGSGHISLKDLVVMATAIETNQISASPPPLSQVLLLNRARLYPLQRWCRFV